MGNNKYEATGSYIRRSMQKSEAYRSLSKVGLFILYEFLHRREMKLIGVKGNEKWEIKNNGEIELPYRWAMKFFHVSARTFTRGIDELIEKGFIEVAEGGNGSGGGHRSKYSIIEDYQRWSRPDFVERKRKKSRRELGFLRKGKNETNRQNCRTSGGINADAL